MRSGVAIIATALLLPLGGCFEVLIPPDPPPPSSDSGGTQPTTPTDGQDDPLAPGPDAGSRGLQPVDSGGTDGNGIQPYELPPSCETHCDCPPEHDCINLVCQRGEMPIYCCTHSICPAGEPCWFVDSSPGPTCPVVEDP